MRLARLYRAVCRIVGVTPRAQRASRQLAARRPCAACGRVVAHTLAGTAFLHRCRPELLKGVES